MGFLKGATIVTLAVVVVCVLAGAAVAFATFGAALGYLFLGGVLVLILANLVFEAMRKLCRKFTGLFRGKKKSPGW